MPAANMVGYTFLSRTTRECAGPENLLQSIAQETIRIKQQRSGADFLETLLATNFVPSPAGSGPALLARALLAAGTSQVLYLAPSHEVGLRAIEDLKALGTLGLPRGTGDEPPPLFLASSETSPYADVHPDRRHGGRTASWSQRALRSAVLGTVAEFCAMAEFINPAVATTAAAMVERKKTERIFRYSWKS